MLAINKEDFLIRRHSLCMQILSTIPLAPSTSTEAKALLTKISGFQDNLTDLIREHLSQLSCSRLDLASTVKKRPSSLLSALNLDATNLTESKILTLAKGWMRALNFVMDPLRVASQSSRIPRGAKSSLPEDTRFLFLTTLFGCKTESKRSLGKGVCGEVLEVSIQDRQYACKKVSVDRAAGEGWRHTLREAVLQECAVYMYLNHNPHPNILKLKGFHSNNTYIELVDTSLKALLESPDLTYANLLSCLFDTVSALRHLHTLGLSHKDVRTGNILVITTQNPWRSKLGDFGFTSVTEGDITPIMDITYAPPELFPPNHTSGSQKADCWALGIIIYEIIMLRHPFLKVSAETDDDYIKRMTELCLNKACPEMIFSSVTAAIAERVAKLDPRGELRDAIRFCLNGNCMQRPSSDEIYAYFDRLRESQNEE